jgi:plastocyanin
MRKTILAAALTLVAAASVAAFADDAIVHQKGRAFSEATITVKKGQPLTFVNDDSVPHNAMSLTSGAEFNIGSQAPGASTPVTFDQVGDVLVVCAIHPRMKLTVKVVD